MPPMPPKPAPSRLPAAIKKEPVKAPSLPPAIRREPVKASPLPPAIKKPAVKASPLPPAIKRASPVPDVGNARKQDALLSRAAMPGAKLSAAERKAVEQTRAARAGNGVGPKIMGAKLVGPKIVGAKKVGPKVAAPKAMKPAKPAKMAKPASKPAGGSMGGMTKRGSARPLI